MNGKKSKFSHDVAVLANSNPTSSDLGLTKELQKLNLVQKISVATEKVYAKALEKDDLRDLMKLIPMLLKIHSSLSQDVGYLMDKIKSLPADQVSLLSSFLEQHELKKGFRKNKLNASKIFGE